MSTVYKKFSKSDVSITPFTAHKQSTFNSASLSNKGGSFYSASFPTVAYKNGSNFEWANSGSDPNNHKKFLQLDHLFYRNAKLEYHNKFSTVKYFDHFRELYDKVNILSLPYKTIGYKIKPGSFSFTQGSNTFKDDSKGNLYLDTTDTLPSKFADEKFKIFNLTPLNGYKHYDLSIEDGKEVINVPTSYSKKGLLDDSFLFNEIEYKNVTFQQHTTYKIPSIVFNGEDSTVVSPHNSRLNFNSDDDFTITFKPFGIGWNLSQGVNDNKKRYLLSKSTTKTVIQSPNLSNNTITTGSSQGVDVEAEPQFPFEIYHQSQSLYFKRFDGNVTSEVNINIPQDVGVSNVAMYSFVKSGSNLEIWSNHTKISSSIDITTQTQNKANLYIGSKGGTNNFWTGSISDIAIYNKALNATEINANVNILSLKPYVGNVFYNNGLVAITHPNYQSILSPANSDDFSLQYQGTHLIYENEYQCMAEQHEFDVTLNPSARKIKSKDSEDLANFATGSNFKPYVTTIGLYNDDGELLVTGKLGQAIRMTDEADTTYVVRFDT